MAVTTDNFTCVRAQCPIASATPFNSNEASSFLTSLLHSLFRCSVSSNCQTGPDAWRYVTPRCPGGTTNVWSPCCLEESVLGNSLYTLARYARGPLADGRFVYL